MKNARRISNLVLKAIAPGIAVASFVPGIAPEAGATSSQMILLSIGLSTLAALTLQEKES